MIRYNLTKPSPPLFLPDDISLIEINHLSFFENLCICPKTFEACSCLKVLLYVAGGISFLLLS